jgi:hypothetical protein
LKIFILFANMISRADIKSMPVYGYERDLSLGFRLLGGSKKNCGHQCRLLQWKKRVVGVGLGCYKGKSWCGLHH